MRPEFRTDMDKPRKYLAGRVYETLFEVDIYGGGKLWKGVIVVATGHLGSPSQKIQRGVRHPKDLYVEVLKKLETKEKGVVVTSSYWVPAYQLSNPARIKRLTKRDLRYLRQGRVQGRLSEIQQSVAPLHCRRKP